MKLRVATPFTANDKVNPIPMLNQGFEMVLLLDPTSCLKAPKSSLSPIMTVNEIPKDDKIFVYAFNLQCLAAKKYLYSSSCWKPVSDSMISSSTAPFLPG